VGGENVRPFFIIDIEKDIDINRDIEYNSSGNMVYITYIGYMHNIFRERRTT